MQLNKLIQRSSPPAPWVEGETIPWNDPEFSERMLKEHLTQEHDMASRRAEVIDQHVSWIHNKLLGGHPCKILDLGCGPGLYASRLTALGHHCTGIDFSPASIAYARRQAEKAGHTIQYRQGDMRQTEFGSGYNLVMLIFGEFNVFPPADARHILAKSIQALQPGGMLLFEPHTFEAVQEIGQAPPFWHSSPGGLFSEQPHIILEENFWDTGLQTSTKRHFVLEADHITLYGASMQAYTQDEYWQVLDESGFKDIHFYPNLTGEAGNAGTSAIHRYLTAITARKSRDES